MFYGGFLFIVFLVLAKHLAELAISRKAGRYLGTFTILSCCLINFSVIVGGTVECSLVLSDITGIPAFYMKIMTLLVFLMVTLFCLEPERLKNLSSFSAIVYLGISEFFAFSP